MTKQQIEMPANPFWRFKEFKKWEAGEKVEWVDQLWEMLDARTDAEDYCNRYRVDWEPRTIAGWKLVREDIPKRTYARLHYITNIPGGKVDLDRDCGFGPCTMLMEYDEEADDWITWMSDTNAEILEHLELFEKLWWNEKIKPRVLINGLGLGVAVKAALHHGASHVDVVENDEHVIELVGPNFKDKPVTIHHADAYNISWPTGTRWNFAWHDIWPTISDENLTGMKDLHRKYGNRVNWQASWKRDSCEKLKVHNEKFIAALKNQDWDLVKRLDPAF